MNGDKIYQILTHLTIMSGA